MLRECVIGSVCRGLVNLLLHFPTYQCSSLLAEFRLLLRIAIRGVSGSFPSQVVFCKQILQAY